MVTTLPLSAYPLEGINKVNWDVADEVSVKPVIWLFYPLTLIVPIAKAEIVIVQPLKVFNLLRVHLT